MNNILQIHNTEITGNLPSEIMLLPASPVIGRDGRSFTYSIDNLLLGWEKHSQDIPIDVDHKSEYGFSTEASGWIKSIFSRDSQLWASVEWTDDGAKLVSQKKYRYISPAFYTNEFNEVQFLSSVALTNHPNLKMPALNHKENKETNNQQEVKKESIKHMSIQLLNKTLGIDENADFTASLNAVMKLKEQKIDLNNFMPKADYDLVLNSRDELQAKLNEIEINILKKEANSIVDNAIKEGQVAESSRDFYLDLCRNSEGLENVKQHLNSKPKLTQSVLANKSNATPQTHSLSAEEISIGKKMGLSEEDLLKSKEIIKKNNEEQGA